MMLCKPFALVAVLTICQLSTLIHCAPSKYPIEHVIVLMLENRAFDHMLGYMKKLNVEIDGLYGNETNPYNPLDANSPVVQVNDEAPYVDPNPGHQITDATQQIFGDGSLLHLDPPPMNGFVKNAEQHETGWGPKIMSCFKPSTVPVISTLASEFALIDKWFSSVPGPTECNRMYVHSATSHGNGDNSFESLLKGYPQKTFYDMLSESNITWNIYFEEITTTLFLKSMRKVEYVDRFKPFEELWYHLRDGKLPAYSFIEPRYFSVPDFPANDQHPAHDVAEGERLIKQVYEWIRNSSVWNKTLLVLTYDEHGGFYDHVPTPLNVPSPDNVSCVDPPFNYTRLGVRVPALLISPWIEKGLVIHQPKGPTPTSQFDHTSIIATLKKVWNLPEHLTARDAWSGTFDEYLLQRDTPRTDCPTSLPEPPSLKPKARLENEHKQPLNDLQLGYLDFVSKLNGDTDLSWMNLRTEEQGAYYCRKGMYKFLNKI